MQCPVCHEREANTNKIYGVMPCNSCSARRSGQILPDSPVEMVGESIKNERIEFAKSIIQPRNARGELSLEYIKAYGTKGIKATSTEVKNAHNIWDGAISQNVDITKTK